VNRLPRLGAVSALRHLTTCIMFFIFFGTIVKSGDVRHVAAHPLALRSIWCPLRSGKMDALLTVPADGLLPGALSMFG